MYTVPTYAYYDIRQAYAGLFLRIWRTGIEDVSLDTCWRVHLENMHHFAEVSRTARHFENSGVPIVFVSERQMVLDHLRQFKLIVLPHMQYLPTETRAALKQYAAEGGRIFVTGQTGAFTEHALLTEPLRDTELGDGATHIEWIEICLRAVLCDLSL
jgi:beta-galactosidase GanA